jgi:hypothetical protein
MAANGSKWQLFGNILAADGQLMGSSSAAKGNRRGCYGQRFGS